MKTGREARLQYVTLRLLNQQLQPTLRACVDESNDGRVIVQKADFEAWVMVMVAIL